MITGTAISMQEMLLPIWQRILQQPSVHVEDNFFELGGDSSLALQLFNEIAKNHGQELPPVTIYQAPTIAALAALLEQPALKRFPPLVLMKSGTERPPVYLAHGLGGSAMDFFQPVRFLQTGHPIYGLQSRGIDGVDEPFDRIDDMALFHLEAIRELQPRGPYLLIGYSLGGLVALEMAQLLTAMGEKVALLAMIDAYPHMSHISLGQRLRIRARQARRGLQFVGDLGGSASYKPPADVSFSPTMQRVRNSAYLALTRYQPRLYRGKVKFVRAAVSSVFPHDAAAVWTKFATDFEVETVPGDHLGVITTHYQSLGNVLSRYLEEARRQG
jgi:thioesterase domain-containing protein/aryl carrier-like protein